MSVRTVLVIDDNPAVASAMEVLLRLRDIRTVAAQSPDEGLAALGRERIDLVICDMNFSADTTSGEEGAALFRALRAAQPDLPVILMTAWTHVETAVRLVKAGAADYISKPWDNHKLLSTIENLLELAETMRERERLLRASRQRREQLASQYDLRDIVFEAEAMTRAVELACRVARADVPVLITGPNGAGKERIAEIVHANSRAHGGPFVAINCGAIPTELVEAELFGAEAGAYTGVSRPRIGRFQLADSGTIFLDEVGNLPIGGQVKLLRVLETGQFEPLGSSRTRSARVRIVSATNADLPALIRVGRFREDLYYRLNAIEIALPPLSERTEDVLPLAQHFLGEDFELSEDALAALLAHDWPGNVRELRNAIERAKLLTRNRVVTASDLNLPAASRQIVHEGDPLTREIIETSLRKARGNISRAAQSIGLSRQAFYRRMERFGLKP